MYGWQTNGTFIVLSIIDSVDRNQAFVS